MKSIQSQSKRIDALLSILRCNECLVSSVAKHFGQTKRKACGRCSACTGEGPLSVETAVSAKIGSSATRYWRSALATHPESLSDPIDAAKFLCGLYTPETTRRKLHKLDGFGCCEDVPFAVVMAELGCAD